MDRCAIVSIQTGDKRTKRIDATHCPQRVVVTLLRDVPDPGQGLVAALLDDLEVPDLDAGDGKVRNLELNRDRNANGCLLYKDGRSGGR